MGLTSSMVQFLGGGCQLWRSAGCPRESSGCCGWSTLCSKEQAGGSQKLQALLQLVSSWAVTHKGTWGSFGFELEGNIESKENHHPPPGSPMGCPWGCHMAHLTWDYVEKGGKGDLQALPDLYFTLLGLLGTADFFPEYVRPTHVEVNMQRAIADMCNTLNDLSCPSLSCCPTGRGDSIPWPQVGGHRSPWLVSREDRGSLHLG